jgi:hypothetical protein
MLPASAPALTTTALLFSKKPLTPTEPPLVASSATRVVRGADIAARWLIAQLTIGGGVSAVAAARRLTRAR